MLEVNQAKVHHHLPAPVFSVVLAGGRSTRMGQDKRFLKFGGEFLVDRAARLGAEISGDKDHVFICGSVPERKCIPDVVLGLGPLGGLLSATDHMERSGILGSNPWVPVFPIDMPFLNQEVFNPLLVMIHEGLPSGCTAISYQGFEMPFIFRCDLKAKDLLEKVCKDPKPSQRSIHYYLESLGIHRINCESSIRNSMINANSPTDWMRVRQEERL